MAMRAQATDMRFEIANYGSDLYRSALTLRELVLRKPLGMALTTEDVARDPGATHFCAIEGEDVIGYVMFDSLGGGKVHLRAMAVHPDRQRQGVGAALLAFAEKWARGRRIREIGLDSREVAVPFYTQLGYATEGQPFIKITIPHIRMVKRLG